jgi:chromosome partitioning protein
LIVDARSKKEGPMPVIVFASSKGGSGKGTSAVLLTTELVGQGTTATLIDADPNQPVVRWSKKPGQPDGLTVVGGVTEETLLATIEEARHRTTFVIVDLEGSANLMAAQAMSRADLVVIPLQGSELDAVEALKVIKFVKRQEIAYGRPIRFSLLFTRTNPAVRPRTLKAIEREFLDQSIPVFGTALHERDAYRAIFSFGGTLYTLDERLVGGLPAAIRNVREYAAEVVALLKKACESAKVPA